MWTLHQVIHSFTKKHSFCNPAEPCRDASVPEPDKFVESSENSLSVHLDGWQDANCPSVYFVVEQRWIKFSLTLV